MDRSLRPLSNPRNLYAMSTSARALSADLGILIIRVIIGVVFMYHGAQKLFGVFDGHGMEAFAGHLAAMEKFTVPMPTVSAWLAALAEFAGGLFILFGLVTRIAVIPVIFTMIVAVAVHWPEFSAGKGGYEYPLTLLLVMVGIGLMGPGRFSLDHFILSQRTTSPEEV